jgi:hypothetical protein
MMWKFCTSLTKNKVGERAPEQTKVQRRSTTCRYKSHTCVLTGYPFAEHRFVIFETLFVQIPFPFSNYLFLNAVKIIIIFKEELSEKRSHSSFSMTGIIFPPTGRYSYIETDWLEPL